MQPIIPSADTIPVAWGWFQFLLLLTFPLHVLAMNAMVGGLAIGVVQHFRGGDSRRRLAHRIAIVLPLVIAFAVNFGVAPLLFLQVLYGAFFYTSSILMGVPWLLLVAVLMVLLLPPGRRALLDRGLDNLLHRTIVAEVHDLGALGLEDPAHDVDGRVVTVEERGVGVAVGAGQRVHELDAGLEGVTLETEPECELTGQIGVEPHIRIEVSLEDGVGILLGDLLDLHPAELGRHHDREAL